MKFRSIMIALLVTSLPFQSYGIFNFAPGYTKLKYSSIGTFAYKTDAWATGKTFVSSPNDGGFGVAHGVTIDVTNDRMYVIDQGNSRINKFVLSSGVYLGSIGNSTAAGSCISGAQSSWCKGGFFSFGTADGMFALIGSVVVDSASDRLYVLEKSSSRIQKFVASTGSYVGAIGNSTASGTCVAGKQTSWCTGGVFSSGAGDGMFNFPENIAIDPAGNGLYVADSSNNRVQAFTLTTGAFIGAIGNSTASGTCVAGKQTSWCTGGVFSSGAGDGMFNSPRGLALNNATNVLAITDFGNQRVELFALSTGAFIGAIGNSTAAGTCIAGKQNGWCTGGVFSMGATDGTFNQPYGIGLDTSSDALFITEKGNHRLQKFTLSTGAFIGGIGNSTAAAGTCVLGQQTGWCTGGTFAASTGDGKFWGPNGAPAADPTNGFLYVTDDTGYRVQKFNSSTGAFVGALGAAIDTTSPISWKQIGGPNSSYPAYIAGVDGSLYNVYGVAVDSANDRLYVSSLYGYNIQKFVLSTGAFVGAIGKSTASGTCVAGKQTSWCTGGNFSSGAGDGMFSNAAKIALDSTNDYLYLLDAGNARVQKFVASTGAFVGAIGKSTASGTCIAGKQNTWCTGGVFSGASTDGAFNSVSTLAFDSTNDAIYVSQGGTSRVQKFTASTGAFVGAIGIAGAASGTCVAGKQTTWCTGGSMGISFSDGGFNSPDSIGVDGVGGFIYVGDTNRIQKFTTSGAFVGGIGYTTASSGTCTVGIQTSWCTGGTYSTSALDGGFGGGTKGIALDIGAGFLYFTDSFNYRIVKLKLSSGAFLGAIGALSTAGGTCRGSNQLKWCSGGGTMNSLSTDGSFETPLDLAIDTVNQRLYIGGPNRVQRVTP